MSITVIKEGTQEGKVPTGPRTVRPRAQRKACQRRCLPRALGDPWGPGAGVRGAWGVVQDSNGAKQGHR